MVRCSQVHASRYGNWDLGLLWIKCASLLDCLSNGFYLTSVCKQMHSGFFKLDSEQTRPVSPLMSHLSVTDRGFVYLRGSEALPRCRASSKLYVGFICIYFACSKLSPSHHFLTLWRHVTYCGLFSKHVTIVQN